MLKVVVTGAGGFVGGFVAKFLADNGLRVTAISRRSVDHIPSNSSSSLKWIHADLCNKLDGLPSFDSLIHCASEIPAICTDFEKLYQNNVNSAENLFVKALNGNCKSVIFLSSMSVYGTIKDASIDEHTPFIDSDAYGLSKIQGEKLLQTYVELGLHSGLSIRLPGTVGKGSHHNFLSHVLEKILHDEEVYANNPDGLFNNIVYIGDLVKFLKSWVQSPKCGYSVVNLGAEEPISIRKVLSLMFELTGRKESLKFLNGGKPSFLINIDESKKLGYIPSTVRESVSAFVKDSLIL
jgi:nucleoside-diphosphate-sugar epimerase